VEFRKTTGKFVRGNGDYLRSKSGLMFQRERKAFLLCGLSLKRKTRREERPLGPVPDHFQGGSLAIEPKESRQTRLIHKLIR
jgi:hypothetical protein